jgi:hypothetical protein
LEGFSGIQVKKPFFRQGFASPRSEIFRFSGIIPLGKVSVQNLLLQSGPSIATSNVPTREIRNIVSGDPGGLTDPPLMGITMLKRQEIDLAEQIKQLESDRERHAAAMEEIDRVLNQINEALSNLKHNAPGHIRGGTDEPIPMLEIPSYFLERRRRRGRFEQTALQSVVDFIRSRGNPSTAEINSHWRAEGRKGTVNVTILKLLQQGKILRQSDPAVRGSRYVLAEEAQLSPVGDTGQP